MEIKIIFDPECIEKHEPEQRVFLSNVHTFQYDEQTSVVDLFRTLFTQSGLVFPETIIIENGVKTCIGVMEVPDPWLFNLFLVKRNSGYLELWDTKKRLSDLLEYLGTPDQLLLYFESDFSDGKAFDEIYNGIEFYYHSDEGCHKGKPHIHARYGDDEITIDLENITILAGKFTKRKKMKQALDFVKERQNKMLMWWNDYTNGFCVDLSS